MKDLLVAVLCLALATQITSQTFIVDAAAGPGSSFTDLPNAIAAVPGGAVLLVRPGNYSPFTIDAKALTIVGEAGTEIVVPTTINDAVTIQNLSANQRVVVRGLEMVSPSTSTTRATIRLQSCQGPVSLAELRGSSATYCTLEAYGCDQVIVGSSEFFHGIGSAIWLNQCVEVVCINCDATTAVGDAVATYGGKLHLVDCRATGGLGSFSSGFYVGGVAVSLGSALLRLSGDCQLEGGPGFSTYPMGYAVDTNWTLLPTSMRSTPSSVLIGGVGQAVAQTVLPECDLAVAGGALGTSVTATLRGTNGNLGALLIGLPAHPVSVPGLQDSFWMAPNSAVPMGLAVFGAPLQTTVQIPSAPNLLGSTFAWQGVTFTLAQGLLASNPAWFTIW